MADITGLPSGVRPLEADWGYAPNLLAFPMPLAGGTRSISLPGPRWLQSLRFNNMTNAKSGLLEAVFVQLEGGANKLVLHRVGRPAPNGKGGGTPVVFGAGQTGTSVIISGLPVSTTGIYVPGDMLGIGGELKLVTAQVDSDSNGRATVNFRPYLRASPANGSAIVVSRPTTRWMLPDPTLRWSHLRARIVSGHAIDLVETFFP